MGGSDFFQLNDEWDVTTVQGVPYGAITMRDLVVDLETRVCGWVIAQSGENGVDVDNLYELVRHLVDEHIGPAILGDIRTKDVPDMHLELVERTNGES